MRILVTGADGFVGCHAVERLVASGHEVFSFTLDGNGPHGTRGFRGNVCDHHVLLRTVEETSPDAVLHLAAIAFVPAVQNDPRGTYEINVGGTLNVLSAVREAAPGARVVFVSSAEVYGRVDDPSAMPLTESRAICPETLYGAGKAAGEHLCRAFVREGLNVIVMRPFNHIGPGQAPDFVLPSFAEQVARIELGQGDAVLRHGNLDAVRDFLDVRDVVTAYECALTASPDVLTPGEPYNVCSGEGIRIGDLVQDLLSRSERTIRAEVDPDRMREVDVPVFVGSADRLRDALPWTPSIPLETTVDDVLAEARARLHASSKENS